MERRSTYPISAIILSVSSLLFAGTEGFNLSLRDAVHYAVDNNREVMQARLELAKADTDLLKYGGKFSWRVLAEAEIQQNKLPFNQNNIFTGTKTQTNTYSTVLENF